MPRMKTRSGAKKRFKITSSGKVKRAKAFRSHILTSKTTKRKRNLRKGGLASKADTRAVKIMLQS
ncbi:MAG TPA: 50S ribosomal protein L35 [Bacteroidota bacterium]